MSSLTVPVENRSAVYRAAHRMFAEMACDLALTLTSEGKIDFSNERAQKFFGMSAQSLRGQFLSAFLAEGNEQKLTQALGQVHSQASEGMELTISSPLGDSLPVQARMFWDPVTSCIWFIGHDLTHSRSIESELRHMATHDVLTGTPNRILLRERIEWHVFDSTRNKTHFAVVALDLDGFKKVNDGLGHLAGDVLLKETAERIKGCLRKVDTVSRTGGDEFMLVLAGVGDEGSLRIACDRILQALRAPITIQGQDVYVSASIGAALYPQHGHTVAELSQHADMAMYQAKNQGKNCFAVYIPELKSTSAEVSLEASMHAAIRNGEFLVFYQPLVDRSGKLLGCEALMRWHRADGSYVSPAEFIPVAESTGLITLLGDYVIRAAAMQLKRFDEAGLTGLYMSVNVSPRQLRHPDFEKNLAKILKLTGIAPHRLVLEITESLLMNGQHVTQALLRKISGMGVRFSLDDFGTGYSCLAYLKTYPISALKIDRSFLFEIERDETARAIVKAIVDLAKALKLSTVVEGVETPDQARVLCEMEVDYLQGYLFGRPVPPNQLLQKFIKQDTQGFTHA